MAIANRSESLEELSPFFALVVSGSLVMIHLLQYQLVLWNSAGFATTL
jgi:hypothetical protein